ncbi:MAG: type IIL restriction-modification enzyme MmeI [Rhodoferax sp.]
MMENEAAQFERPFEFALEHVQPVRKLNNRPSRARYWWRHGEARPGLRNKLAGITRYIATVETAKHRFFVFFPVSVAPEHSLIVIPRADDTSFGLLSSRIHVLWALARGGRMGKGNDPRYNSLAAFEPFPFPTGLTPADTAHQQTEQVEGGALIPARLSDHHPRRPYANKPSR